MKKSRRNILTVEKLSLFNWSQKRRHHHLLAILQASVFPLQGWYTGWLASCQTVANVSRMLPPDTPPEFSWKISFKRKGYYCKVDLYQATNKPRNWIPSRTCSNGYCRDAGHNGRKPLRFIYDWSTPTAWLCILEFGIGVGHEEKLRNFLQWIHLGHLQTSNIIPKLFHLHVCAFFLETMKEQVRGYMQARTERRQGQPKERQRRSQYFYYFL